MGKILYFLPAVLFTCWTLCLNVLTGALIPLWHIWNTFFWVSGFAMSRGKLWGVLLGLLPPAHILYMNPGLGLSVEWVTALSFGAWYLVCGAWIYFKEKRKEKR